LNARLLLLVGVGWGTALLPVVLSASLKTTVAVWAFLFSLGIVLPEGPRARRCLILFLLFVSFSAVDYIGLPIHGFVGGAPAGLAYYPADFWLLLALVLATAERAWAIPVGPLRLLLFLGLVLTVAEIPSLFVASAPIAAFQQWVVLPRAMLAGLLAYSQARTHHVRRQLALCLLVGFLVQSGVAVAQHVQGTVLGLSWLGEAPAEYLAKTIAPGLILWRSGGTLGHPNVLATFLVGLVPLSAVTTVMNDRGRTSRVVAVIILGVGLAALVWTYSRGAWAALAVVGAYVLLMSVRKLLRSQVIIPIGVLGLILLMIALPTIRHRLTQTESSATDVRFALISVALEMAASNPLSGVGLNHFAEELPAYDPIMALELFRHPVHNVVLLDMAEAGIVVGIASLLFWGTVVVAAGVYVRRAVVQHAPLAAAFWAGAGCITLHNVVDWTLRRPDILLLLWVLLALGSAAIEESPRGARGD
jgi:hypothetical protein